MTSLTDEFHDTEVLDFDNGEPVIIIGNGEGALPDVIPGSCILFNQRRLKLRKRPHQILRVLNSRTTFFDSEDDDYVVSLSSGEKGESRSLSIEFHTVAIDLSEQLYCWPSCGLVALFWAVGRGLDVSCYQMELSPTLSRDVGWPAGYAPPTVFHNYLGERRLALTQLSTTPTRITWPGILLPEVRLPLIRLEPSASSSLSDELRRLQDSNAPVTSRRKQLGQLVSQLIMDPSMMLAAASDIEAEKFFYLPRNVRHTDNWWLYDYEASLIIDSFVTVLRQYQQVIYLVGS